MNDVAPDEQPAPDGQTAVLPVSIAADLQEAALCCSAGAYRGAALLARRAVEQVAVLRRVPLEMGTLHQKVVWLLRSGHLPRELSGHARIIGEIGTAAAHGGEVLTRDEAEAVVSSALALARAVLAPDASWRRSPGPAAAGGGAGGASGATAGL